MNNKNLKILIAGSAFLAILLMGAVFLFYPKAEEAKESVALTDWTADKTAKDWGKVPGDTPLEVGPGSSDLESPFVVVAPSDLPPTDDTSTTSGLANSESVTTKTVSPPLTVSTGPKNVGPTTVHSTAPVASKPAPKVKVTEYWIQVAAYGDRYAAERSSQTLSSQNMTPVLFTAQTPKGTVYRVRLGPYKNKQEADKYLGWVQGMKDFAGAYITQSTALREIR